MYRVVNLGSGYIAVKHDMDSDDDKEAIETFTIESTPVILVEDLEDLESLGVDPDTVKVV